MDGIAPAGAQNSGLEVAPGVYAPAAAIRFGVARSGGPGGQNVNKLNTKIELWVRPEMLVGLKPAAIERLRNLAGRRLTGAGEIHISAANRRSQEANRADALARLRELVVRAKTEPKIRRKTRPSRASKIHRLEHKRHRSEVKSARKPPRPQ